MSAVQELLRSKKFLTMVAGMVSFGATYIGLDWSLDAVAMFMTPIVAFILAQGVADNGKEAAKIDSARAQLDAPGKADGAP